MQIRFVFLYEQKRLGLTVAEQWLGFYSVYNLEIVSQLLLQVEFIDWHSFAYIQCQFVVDQFGNTEQDPTYCLRYQNCQIL